jgi:hypothetical protein
MRGSPPARCNARRRPSPLASCRLGDTGLPLRPRAEFGRVILTARRVTTVLLLCQHRDARVICCRSRTGRRSRLPRRASRCSRPRARTTARADPPSAGARGCHFDGSRGDGLADRRRTIVTRLEPLDSSRCAAREYWYARGRMGSPMRSARSASWR